MIASLKALREAWRERSVGAGAAPQCLTPSSSPGVARSSDASHSIPKQV